MSFGSLFGKRYPDICYEPEYTEAADALVNENPRYDYVLRIIEWGVVTKAEEYAAFIKLPARTAMTAATSTRFMMTPLFARPRRKPRAHCTFAREVADAPAS